MLNCFSHGQLFATLRTVTPGSSVNGILQARILEWTAVLSYRDIPDRGIEPVSFISPALASEFFTANAIWEAHEVKLLSRVRLFVTPWTVAHQAPPSMGFSWQVYWSGLPFPSPGDLPHPGIEPGSPAL